MIYLKKYDKEKQKYVICDEDMGMERIVEHQEMLQILSNCRDIGEQLYGIGVLDNYIHIQPIKLHSRKYIKSEFTTSLNMGAVDGVCAYVFMYLLLELKPVKLRIKYKTPDMLNRSEVFLEVKESPNQFYNNFNGNPRIDNAYTIASFLISNINKIADIRSEN